MAEYESIQRAATALRVSASSLSRTIKLLEEQLGTHLFVRSSSGVSLTEQGQALLGGTREAMQRIDEAIPDPKRRLTLGVEGPLLSELGALGLSRLPSLAAWLVSMRELTAAEAREGLLCGEVDLALVHASFLDSALDGELLTEQPWVIAGHPGGGEDALVSCAANSPVPVSHLVSSLEAARRLSGALPARLVVPRLFLNNGLVVLETLPITWRVHAIWSREAQASSLRLRESLLAALKECLV